jgi:ABC-2 type transport system permease protein
MRKIWGIMLKELLQLKRERVTLGMIVGMPLFMILLFGYAINTDPRNLPTVVFDDSKSSLSRSFIAGLEISGYFKITSNYESEAAADNALKLGRLNFVIHIPHDFARSVYRGETPDILVEADATDSSAVLPAVSTIPGIIERAAEKEFINTGYEKPYNIIVHRRYNPEQITSYNIIPGLIGMVLLMSLVLMTGLSMTRERERGTLENLFVMPLSRVQVTAGKLAPYVLIGIVQVTLVLTAAFILFRLPFAGGFGGLAATVLLMETALLTVGITISSVAKSQLQAMQMTLFFLLPNIFLSGYIFPFRGMPGWARTVGELLPLTHFNRMIRGVMLKGSSLWEILPQALPLVIFIAVMTAVALKAYSGKLE